MGLVMDALRTAIDRFKHHALIIIAFAVVVVTIQFVVRAVTSAASQLNIFVSVAMLFVSFLATVYLSFVAFRFSYRALVSPIFDLSASFIGVLRLAGIQIVVSFAALPYLFVPLIYLVYAFVRSGLVPRTFEHGLTGELVDLGMLDAIVSPAAISVAVVLVLVSVYVTVRWSMAGFSAVIDGRAPLGALVRSWRITNGSFWPILAYMIIPYGFVLVFALLLLLVAAFATSLGIVGIVLITVVSIALFAVYVLIVDPTIAIGRARLFESLSQNT